MPANGQGKKHTLYAGGSSARSLLVEEAIDARLDDRSDSMRSRTTAFKGCDARERITSSAQPSQSLQLSRIIPSMRHARAESEEWVAFAWFTLINTELAYHNIMLQVYHCTRGV